MPLPTPNEGETQDDFMDRCMGDDAMVEEYEDSDQRYAVCQSQWDKKDNSARAIPKGRQWRAMPGDVKVTRAKSGEVRIRGYGAVFYDGSPETEFELWPGTVERIIPGAFDRAIKEDDVRGLFNHNPDLVLGRTSSKTMKLSVDGKGLKYAITPGSTQTARDVIQHIKRRDVTGSSFSFEYTNRGWVKADDGRTVLEVRGVKLYDTGPVTFPAYPATDAQARSDFDALRRSYEQFCKRNGTAPNTTPHPDADLIAKLAAVRHRPTE